MASKRKSSSVRTVHLSQRDQASITSLLKERLKPWLLLAGWVAAFGSAAGVVISGYIWLGLPWLITDRVLYNSITTVKTEVGGKIEASKAEVKSEVHTVQKTVDDLNRRADRNELRILEAQLRTLYLQKTTIETQLAGMDYELRKPTNKNNAVLTQERANKKTVLDYVNTEMSRVQAQVAKAKGE